MLQEAGFHPLEVIQAATMNGALTLAEPRKERPQFGIVRAGMLADMVIVDQNPLQNFKVLYGTGAVRLNDETGRPERVGGIKWTIKGKAEDKVRSEKAEVKRQPAFSSAF
jgi:adenine deaminase